MRSIFPQLFAALTRVAEIRGGAAPRHIYVTGHSLGGALAQHFVSAVLLGDWYGPGGRGARMPAALRDWPWTQVKLITFSAPRAGDEAWARTLTEAGLQSGFFSGADPLDPLDRDALTTTDSSIVPRLLDPRRPAGYRVQISSDPLTSERLFGGGKPVGKTVYVDQVTARDRFPGVVFDSHEVTHVRRCMEEALADPRTPPASWSYRKIPELCPDCVGGRRGRPDELTKLAEAIERYHAERGSWLDGEALDRDLALRLRIAGGR